MQFFHKILMILASLALCLGCSSTAGQPDSSTNTESDGGSHDGNVSGDQGSSTDAQLAWDEFYLTLKAKTPDGKPADFYVCQDSCGTFDPVSGTWSGGDTNYKTYKNKSDLSDTFNGKKNANYVVTAMRQDYLFVDWTFATDPTLIRADLKATFSHQWTDAGSWGLAPNGMYEDSLSQKKMSIAAHIGSEQKIFLKIFSFNNAIINNDAFVAGDSNDKLTGTISVDLQSITYVEDCPACVTKKFEGTLTLVK